MTGIAAIRFTFNTQESGYVGYTQLAVLGTATTTAVNWTGAGGNGNWDTTTTNWTNSGSNVASTYTAGTAVTFSDDATNTAISIPTGGMAPSAVYFTNDLTAYSFTGADSTGITGSAPVTVGGFGKVTFSSPNTYTGATTVNRGTLDIANQIALQNSTLAPAGGSVVFDQTVTGNAFTVGGLVGNGNLSLQNNATSPVGVTLSVGNNNANTTYTGVLSGSGGFTKIEERA